MKPIYPLDPGGPDTSNDSRLYPIPSPDGLGPVGGWWPTGGGNKPVPGGLLEEDED